MQINILRSVGSNRWSLVFAQLCEPGASITRRNGNELLLVRAAHMASRHNSHHTPFTFYRFLWASIRKRGTAYWVPRIINRVLSIEKERNRGQQMRDEGDASQPGGPCYWCLFLGALCLMLVACWMLRGSWLKIHGWSLCQATRKIMENHGKSWS